MNLEKWFVIPCSRFGANGWMQNSQAYSDRLEHQQGVGVTTCNRNGPDLQSSRFSTGIDCVYPSQQTGIICE
ncbi:hypothetical protein [Pseudomonas syringae]|uniref:hypothetical protein n=1 Tax=Pseudomonas syringae TaxID=317 RepID=UPI000AFBF596|nr:hypothetical protein [Pseudomonas syringae]